MGRRYHVAEVDGRVVGVIAVRDDRHIFRLFVSRRFQRRGIARALVELVQHGFVDTTNLAAFSAGNAGPASGSGAGRAGVHASVEIEDYYGALGVERTATYEQIHAAFRALARQCHPDVNKSVEAEQRFGYVAKAYAVLRDPAKRAQYDHRLSAAAVHAKAA